ncbi:hypothetical protein HK100_000580 [Physocladia obscura]|uniref:PHD-type domain-containing protein n=1 Tax=Physocladia obscura TaxID=109957 RepID=A0AAD5XCF9_9FUNG|nr:hypothetical protein HK100_000580 [Physocladia obscura]
MEETKAVQVGIRQSTALTDGNNADFPPPATSGGANEHQMAGEAEQAAKARLFAQLFGGGSVESDTDSLLSDCSECLSDSSHNVSETAAASIKHPSLAKPKSKEREPSSRATRRGSRSAQGLKQTDQKENTPNTRKELGNSAPSNLYNPFKLLARSPFDGSFGVSFLANGLNHASAVNASISAQNEWDEVCDDWAAIVSVSPAVVQPHNQSHSINYDGNYEYTVGSDLLKNHSSGSVNNETPLSTTPAASTSFIQPPPAFLSDDNCAACLGRGELLCCDSCPKVFHFCCVAEGFSNDGLDAPNMWECNACRWRNIHGKCYAPELNLPKPIKTVKRTKNSSPSPQPAENESSRIKSAFDVLSHVIDGHNPRSFELPNHIWMPYACVYKHPLTGDYIDLIQTEVIEVAAPAPNGTAPPLTRRNNSAFLSRASVTSTASTNPVYPTTTTFSATTSAEWTQVVTRIKGTVADWVHDPQYNQFNISLSALKQNFATTVVDKTKKPETKYILTTSPTHSHPPFTRTLPFCHACALSAPGRQDMIKCDHCDVWWHPECLPILFFAAPISRSITSATLSGGGVPGGTIGHARTPPPTRDVDCVDVAFARDVRRRCWGSMWMEADESGGKQGSVYFRRRWMCPLHVDWAVSDAGVGSMRVRRRKRKRVFVVDCTDAGEKVVSGQIVEMDNVLKGKAVGIGVADGSEMDTVILPGEGGAEAAMLTLLTGNVAETGDKVGGVGDDSSQLLIVNVEDEPVSSPSGISASFSVEMDQIDGASRNDAEQEDVILKRKIRIKADPSVLAMIAALTNSYRQNDDGVVIQIPAKLNQFQKSFGVGRGSVKTKRGRAAATATVTAAYIPKNDPQSAVNSENRVDKNVENENSFSSNGLEAKSKPATDVIFQHTARSEFGNISPNLHVAIDNDLNEDLGEEDDEAVTNANIESEAKIIENSLDDVPIINTAIPKKSLEMIDLSNSISGENYQKKTTHDTLNSENNVSNGSLLDTVNKTDAFDSERAEKREFINFEIISAITDKF